MESNYFNETVFGIHNNVIKYTWIGYFLFIFLSSLIGDTLILVASIKFRAFKLHSFIVVCIQHIAVCDLMVSFTSVLPRLVSLMAGGWVLGDALCAIGPFIMIYPVTVSLLLICLMTTSKLVILKFPSKSSYLTSNIGHLMSTFIWLSSTNISIALLVDKNDVAFDYRSYICQYGFSSEKWKWLQPVIVTVNVTIPNLLVIGSTVPLVMYLVRARRHSKRSRGAVRWQGILTTFITAAVYSISAIPYAVYRFLESQAGGVQDPDSSYFRLAVSFLFLNTLSNFYIYLFTVPSFRNYVQVRIRTQLLYFSSLRTGFSNCKLWRKYLLYMCITIIYIYYT